MRQRARLSERVAGELLRQIVNQEIREDEVLLRESDLASLHDVSRPVLREAIKSLEGMRMVEARQGRGTVVLPARKWDVLNPYVLTALLESDVDGRVFEDLSVVRMGLEPELALLAAQNATPAQLLSMRTVLQQAADSADDGQEFLEHDLRFHQLVAEAANSVVGEAVLTLASEPLRLSRRLTNQIPGALEHAMAAHQTIYEAVAARDELAAQTAMREHLLWTRESLRVLRLGGQRE